LTSTAPPSPVRQLPSMRCKHQHASRCDASVLTRCASAAGREAYLRAGRQWAAAHAAELGPELAWQPLRCAATGPDTLLLSWEATWIPLPMMGLVRFGRCARMRCLRGALGCVSLRMLWSRLRAEGRVCVAALRAARGRACA
jgi:hypothetical protein